MRMILSVKEEKNHLNKCFPKKIAAHYIIIQNQSEKYVICGYKNKMIFLMLLY